jgi:hypothetical protein
MAFVYNRPIGTALGIDFPRWFNAFLPDPHHLPSYYPESIALLKLAKIAEPLIVALFHLFINNAPFKIRASVYPLPILRPRRKSQV